MRVSKFEHMDVGFSQGNLSLVEIFEVNYISKGRTMALWRCQCGFQFRSSLWSVLLSKKHCCGCSKVIGNVGTTIKNWLVVDFLGRDKHNNFTFKLLCNTCGKEKIVANTTMMNSLNACNHKTRLKQNHPMKGLSYKLLTKSWEDPDGFMHEGEWREFELVTITKSKRKHAIDSGFGHLVNGEWLWVKYPDIERVCYVHLHTIDKVVDMNDNGIELEYEGLNFKLKEI